MFDLELVNYIAIGIFAFILVMPMFFGLLRGYKKSLFRLIWVTVTFVLLFFFSAKLTSFLVTLHLPFNIVIGETTCSSVMDVVLCAVYSIPYAKEVLATAPFLSELITTIPVMFVTVFVFTILFWALKWLLWPIWAIISACTIKNYNVTYHEGKKLKIKTKKRRLVGAGLGLAMGYLVAVITFTPVIGYSHIITLIEEETKAEGSDSGILSQVMGEQVGLIYVYEDGLFKSVATSTGMDALSNVFFASLSSAQISNSTVTMENEVKVLSSLAYSAMPLANYDYQNLTKNDISEISEIMTELIDKVFSSGLITGTADELLDFFTKKVVEDPSFIEPYLNTEENVSSAIIDFCQSMNDVDMVDIKTDLQNIVEVIKILNDNDMVIPLLKNEVSLENYKSYVSVDAVNTSIDKILTGRVMKKVIPIAINLGVEYLCNTFDAQFEKANINVNNIANALKTLVSGAYNTIDQVYVDGQWVLNDLEEPMSTLGNVLNYLDQANALSTKTKTSLLNVAKNYAVDYVKAQENLTTYASVVDKILTKLVTEYAGGLVNWKTEFDVFTNLYVECTNYFSSTSYEHYNLETIGMFVDNLSKTKLFDTCIEDIINEVISMVEERVAESGRTLELSYLGQSIVDIADNESLTYSNEFKKLQNIYDLAMEYKDIFTYGSIIDEIKTGDLLEKLGEEFDLVASSEVNSKILNLGTLRNLASQGFALLDESMLPESLREVKVGEKTLLEALSDNASGIVNFKSELAQIKDIINIDFGTINMTELGAKLDGYKTNSRLLEPLIVPVAETLVDAITLPDIVKDVMVGDKTIKDALKANLSLVENWTEELELIDTLGNLSQDNIGSTLDNLKQTKLVGADIVNAIVSDQIEKADLSAKFDTETVAKIKEQMTNNIPNVLSWATEMGYLDDILNIDMDNVDATLTAIKDSVLLNGVVDIVAEYEINQANIPTGVVSESAIAQVKAQMISNIENVLDWSAEFDNLESLTSITTGNRGAVLDSLSDSKLFEGVVTIVVGDVIDSATLPDKLKDITIDGLTVKAKLKANTTSVTSWTDELGYLDKVLTIDDDNMGEVLDQVKTSKLFEGVLDKIIEQEIDTMAESIGNSAVVNIIKANLYKDDSLNTTIDFSNEIETIKKLQDLTTKTNTEIGAILDEVSQTTLVGVSGTNLMLRDAIDSMEVAEKYESTVSGIKNNVDNITVSNATATVYSTELSILDRLVTEMNKSSEQVPDFSFILDKEAENTILDLNGNSTSVLVTDSVIADIKALLG